MHAAVNEVIQGFVYSGVGFVAGWLTAMNVSRNRKRAK